MSYTNIFGGFNINTAFPSYMNYTFSGNLQLNWASSFVDTEPGTNNVTAQINDISGTNIIINLDNNPFTTTLGSGVIIVTIPPNINLKTGNLVKIEGAIDTNGIMAAELNIIAPITVISSTSFSYTTAGIAGGGPFVGGGNAVTYAQQSTITLADATLISSGQTVQFNNIGSTDITIFDFSGNELAIIPPTVNSNQYILYLQNNTTQAGEWGITHLGAGTSSSDASVLSGMGMVALNSKINANFPGKTIGADYQVILNDRASILVWTGGAGTITLPNQVAGFYIAVNNEGSGVASISTPDSTTIDGNASFPLNPSESSYFIAVGQNWNTLGFGVESFFQVNVLPPINLSGVNPSRTLTNSEASHLVQQYTGNLSNNVTVFYPAAAGQWYIWNNTTGAFSVTVQLAGPTGNPVVIPQGEKIILYSDGNSIYNIPTIATSAVFPDGTVGAPGINFQAQNTTGFYRISSGLTGYASAGTQGITLGGPIPGYSLGFSGGLESRYYDATNTNYVGFQAGALAGNTIWTLPLTDSVGTQVLISDGGGILSWETMNAGTVTSVTGVLNRISVVNPTTTPIVDIDAAYVGQASITTLGTITTGTWNATPVPVAHGGSGLNTLTIPFGVVCAGTVPTGNLQNAGTGTVNQVFTSNGAAALPSWKNINVSLPGATKVDQITGTSTAVYTNPAVQQFHNSAAKAWLIGNPSGVILSSYNIASIVNTSLGEAQINFITPFTSLNYSNVGTVIRNVGDRTYVFNLLSINSSSQISIRTASYLSNAGNYNFSLQSFGVQ